MNTMWVAVYKDMTVLEQFNESGEERSYGDIDREQLSEFHIIDKDTRRTVYALALDEGQRLIYRRRNSMSGNSGQKIAEVILVGWQQTVAGKNVQSIQWIFEDGSIIGTGKFREDHRVFYSVELLDFENVGVS